jgi:MoxR-like ATPase
MKSNTAILEIPSPGSISQAENVINCLRERLRRAVKGRDEVIDLVLTALLADGHVLLEDYPGSGKTSLAKALGESIHEESTVKGLPTFRRIQFTPDLLPSDMTGVSVFEPAASTFEFRPGPVFTSILLADEINRTSPKVQAAMLEAMAEKQVTVDNVSHPLNDLFFVIATQNPRETAGTYPLPLPQLDRFLFKIKMDHISRDAELEVLAGFNMDKAFNANIRTVSRREILDARRAIREAVFISPAVQACLVDAARALRSHPNVAQGVSTRSLVLMLPALQVGAVLAGRDFVSSADIENLAPYVFCHRLELNSSAKDANAVVAECLAGPLENLSRSTLSRSF